MTLQTNRAQPVKLHRIKNAALLLDVSKPTIYRLVRAGKLTLVKLGTRASAITDESIRDFIAAHTQSVGNGS
ncbi:MAG: helix-turn-helix domain-containing protein [Paraburkholderia sp.]|uniref:helix-turn-helix transcriptional regulator n=1 Tax=Paraburkholderia sp. TaxID=1926495 RepID=UPI001212EE90|nr:helix-turn-helix domain-containing protein [Paraburkholderia sp.]TAM02174.1 MAG: helix-turn-helix domain-containing protein [Paraburkholderia sp.]TAM29865.1 MAG: helix-turn-helix domain-containing protein [Paraburkholderia sp.]